MLPSARTALRLLSAPLIFAACMVQPCWALQGSYHLFPAIEMRSEDTPAAAGGVEGEPETTAPQAAPAEPHPHWVWAGLISAGIIGGTAVNSFTDSPQGGFHVTQEHWFGENAYVGGADKASHFVSFEIIALELATGLERHLGFTQKLATIGGFAVSSLAGVMNEIGDGTNKYGFSYEDVVMDVLGAGAGAVIHMTGTRDLFGFRFGLLTGPLPPRQTDGIGRDYSREIYTADFKFGGLGRRLKTDLGPARFLLVSTTYGVSGYPYGGPDEQQRLVGFEIGLNFQEMLYALNVYDDTWWGFATHVVIDNFRIPYTQLGFRYDVNHGHWYGPVTGGTI